MTGEDHNKEGTSKILVGKFSPKDEDSGVLKDLSDYDIGQGERSPENKYKGGKVGIPRSDSGYTSSIDNGTTLESDVKDPFLTHHDKNTEVNKERKEEDSKIPNHKDIQEVEIVMEDRSEGLTCRDTFCLVLRLLRVLCCLFFFICSLDLLSSSFQLLGGKAAGTAFRNSELLKNPICGLMLGVVATAILQSSSTSTSIVTTMVAGDLLTVPMAIPIVMGANIGTSVTGVLVAVAQAGDRETFRRSFSAATVHDTFNWLTVFILLPLEIASGLLYRITSLIVSRADLAGGAGSKQEFLKVLTKPVTKMIIQLDKRILGALATGEAAAANMTLLKDCDGRQYLTMATGANHSLTATDTVLNTNLKDMVFEVFNTTQNHTTLMDLPSTIVTGKPKCWYIFHGTSLSDQAVGGLILLIALAMLLLCLSFMVRDLKALLAGQMAKVIQKRINADFPGICRYFTGYAFILLGAILTVLVQSSSVVVSTLTPLVGVEFVSVERAFPMMLGANLGTTSTAILAAFASTGNKVRPSLQIALCHIFFNLMGIIIWYPVFFMRRIPLGVAKYLGRTTAQYRWFAFMYLIVAFFLFPLTIFGLSLLGWQALAGVGIPVVVILLFVLVVNILQRKKKSLLPTFLQTWDFLPEFMRSLKPLDSLLSRVFIICRCNLLCDRCNKKDTKYTTLSQTDIPKNNEENVCSDTKTGDPNEIV